MQRKVARRVQIALPRMECLNWCRSAEARQCWPGVKQVVGDADGLILHYEVALRAPGAKPAALTVEEHLTAPLVSDANGVTFLSTYLWRWPSGALASGWGSHEISTQGASSMLRFSFEYLLPGSVVIRELFDEMRHGKAIERAIERYVHGLATRHGSASEIDLRSFSEVEVTLLDGNRNVEGSKPDSATY